MDGYYRIKAFVIDDEQLVLDDVADELRSSGLFEIMGTFTNLPDALLAVGQLGPPDFILCDIHMEGVSGLQVTTLFGGVCDFIVFMTGHPEYSQAAFKAYPEGCVFKPVGIDDLMPLVSKFFKQRQTTNPVEILGGQLLVYSSEHQDVRPIRVNDILYAEADTGYVAIYTEAKAWLTDISMADLTRKLAPTGLFMRISAKHLVAYPRITHIKGHVVYVGNKDMKVTALGKAAFDAYLEAVWSGQPKSNSSKANKKRKGLG